MPKRLRVTIWMVMAAALIYLIYASTHTEQYSVEVCVRYQSVSACRVSQGKTQAEATKGALDNACSQVTSGVTGTLGCQDTQPTSVRVLSAP